MKKSHMKSMTEGSPAKLLIGFMVPLLLGLLFQQFYYMVDTMVVGKLLGATALAGVGSTGAINFLVLGFCTGICSGFTIPVAQKFGQEDYDGLRRFVGNIAWLGGVLAVGITVVVSVLCSSILRWMNTPAETFDYAFSYIFIIFLGIPSMMLYNLLSGIIRSLGDSKTPLFFLIFSSLLNVALDIILILWAKLGVAGASLATVISQVVSGVLCFFYMCRRFPILHLHRDDLRPRKFESYMLLSMGLPMGLQYSITAIGSTMLQTAVNSLGPAAMAATTASSRVVGLFACPLDAIGTAAATYTGQNIGAGKLKRINSGVNANFVIGMVYSVLAYFVAALWGQPLMMLFLDTRETHLTEILELSRQFLMMNMLFFPALLWVNLYRFTIQGMGFSKIAVVAGVMELAARGLLAAVLVPHLGFTAVSWANPAAWIMADIFLIPVYFYTMKLLKRRQKAQFPEDHRPI